MIAALERSVVVLAVYMVVHVLMFRTTGPYYFVRKTATLFALFSPVAIAYFSRFGLSLHCFYLCSGILLGAPD